MQFEIFPQNSLSPSNKITPNNTIQHPRNPPNPPPQPTKFFFLGGGVDPVSYRLAKHL